MLRHYQSLKLSLINVGFDKLDHRWNFDNVISPFTRLYYVTEGEAFVYHNQQKIRLEPGFLYLIPSYTYSSYKCNDSHHQYYISFFEEYGSGLSIYNFVKFVYKVKATELDAMYFERLLYLNPNRTLLNNNPIYYDKFSTLLEYEKKNNKLSASKYIETFAILKILLSRFVIKGQPTDNVANINLDSVLTYISENLEKDLSVSFLADFCNLSRDHFSRSFKKQYNIRPSNYVQNLRIERAMLLLITTNYSVEEISLKVGFESYIYFLRFFKQNTNKSPKEFRKEHMVI